MRRHHEALAVGQPSQFTVFMPTSTRCLDEHRIVCSAIHARKSIDAVTRLATSRLRLKHHLRHTLTGSNALTHSLRVTRLMSHVLHTPCDGVC